MGQSTDAILAYGFDLDAIFDEEINVEEIIPTAVRFKISQLEGYYDLEESVPDYLKQHDCEGVELVHHCSCDYTMYILGFPMARAWRGDVRRLDLTELSQHMAGQGGEQKVRKAAQVLGIDTKDKTPGWLLVSMWC